MFDKFLINEALDIIEAAGGSFHLVNCRVGQSVDAISYSELEVSSHLFIYDSCIKYQPREPLIINDVSTCCVFNRSVQMIELFWIISLIL